MMAASLRVRASPSSMRIENQLRRSIYEAWEHITGDAAVRCIAQTLITMGGRIPNSAEANASAALFVYAVV